MHHHIIPHGDEGYKTLHQDNSWQTCCFRISNKNPKTLTVPLNL